MTTAFYYPPTGGAPQLINLNQAAKLEAMGYTPVSGHYVSKAKTTKANKPKVEKTKTVKSNPTSTTKKTVSRTTNKKGETVIKVNKTITIKKK